MELRPYQTDAVEGVLSRWRASYRDPSLPSRLLGVAPTGSGKTIVFSSLTQATHKKGRTLILAHREELIDQAIAKLWKSSGIMADKEKAEHRARLSAEVVVGSVQTLLARAARFPRDHFRFVIIDECHHVLAESYQKTLKHFQRGEDNPNGAFVLGVTATADRADKRNLGEYFQEIAFEIHLLDLIRQGYLAPIIAKTVPLTIDLSGVRKMAGDFALDDLGNALTPALRGIVDALKEHALGRKIVVFLPLCATSRVMQRLCAEAGIDAWHVDGESPDRKEILSAYSKAKSGVLCNSMLLTEGWDEPSVDCVVVLRATQSRGLYAQMIGRGTRLFPGKENLLILDFLWHTEKHTLCKPASLFAKDAEEAADMSEIIDAHAVAADAGEMEFEAQDELGLNLDDVMTEARAQREAKLKAELAAQQKKTLRLVDPVTFALDLDEKAAATFEITEEWQGRPVSTAQKQALLNAGFDPDAIANTGHASAILDLLATRRQMGLATPKQVAWLKKMKVGEAMTMSKDEASAFMGARFARGKTQYRKAA